MKYYSVYGYEFCEILVFKIRGNDDMLSFLSNMRKDFCVILTNYRNATQKFLELEKEILEYGYFEKIVDGNRVIYFESGSFELSLF